MKKSGHAFGCERGGGVREPWSLQICGGDDGSEAMTDDGRLSDQQIGILLIVVILLVSFGAFSIGWNEGTKQGRERGKAEMHAAVDRWYKEHPKLCPPLPLSCVLDCTFGWTNFNLPAQDGGMYSFKLKDGQYLSLDRECGKESRQIGKTMKVLLSGLKSLVRVCGEPKP